MKTIVKSVLLILTIVISACQNAPQAEIDEAKALLDSAQTENIHIIYPEEFQMLKDSINIVLEGIETENSKFLLKKYDTYNIQLKRLIKETKQLIQRNKDRNEVEELTKFQNESETEV
jgi:hypothetical protein